MPRAAKPAPGPLSLEIAAILRAQMGRKGINKVQLAEASGLNRTTLSDIVRGPQQADIEQLEALCVALDLRLTATIREAEKATEGRQFQGGGVA